MGWFKVDRSIQGHWLWNSPEPFDSRSAWIDLLLMANHKDFKTYRKGKLVYRKRGEVNTSTRFLAERWRWSRNRVTRFLKTLESDGMVSLSGATDGTTITVENYEKYQSAPTTNGATDDTTDGATHEATDGANDKNLKKGKEGKDTYRGVGGAQNHGPNNTMGSGRGGAAEDLGHSDGYAEAGGTEAVAGIRPASVDYFRSLRNGAGENKS